MDICDLLYYSIPCIFEIFHSKIYFKNQSMYLLPLGRTKTVIKSQCTPVDCSHQY